ncbi:MAG: sigma-70 family RNA polymerase sigma factor [Planctomycetes bacterium]|nr:sigma-70 family RNA polymerase sigma factor [Planctomycetota bacterium]
MTDDFSRAVPVRQFATTRWSVVVAAGAGDPGNQRRRLALEELCQTYWYPLYAYVRRRGYSRDDAQDLTQAFFARLLEKNIVRVADPQKGKFRSFLLATLKDFLLNQRRHDGALKRGGGRTILPLEFEAGEERYRLEPADERTPEDLFQRRWALTILEQALARIRREHQDADKENLFQHLKECLGGSDARSYREIGEAIGMTEGSVKVAVHRLRARYRELLRDEVAQTLDADANLDAELQELFDVLGR